LEVWRPIQAVVNLLQVKFVVLPHLFIRDHRARGAIPFQHLVLRAQDLFDVASHEKDLVVQIQRQVLQEKRDGLNHLASVAFEPAFVGGLVEFFDALELMISLGIIFIGSPYLVRDNRHSPLFQHLHQHGRARTRQAGNRTTDQRWQIR
jgi:hypothetical protein